MWPKMILRLMRCRIFVILFTNDSHSQIEPTDTDKGGMPVNSDVRLVIRNSEVKSLTIDYLVNTEDYLQDILSRRDSEEYIRDYFGNYFRFRAENDPKGHITASVEGRITIEQ